MVASVLASGVQAVGFASRQWIIELLSLIYKIYLKMFEGHCLFFIHSFKKNPKNNLSKSSFLEVGKAR